MKDRSYYDALNDINKILSFHKKASDNKHITDEDVLGGNRTATEGEGEDVNDEGDDEAKVTDRSPSQSSNSKKSVDYLLEKDKIETATDKAQDEEKTSGAHADILLKKIYNLMYKSAEGEKEEEEEEEEVEEDAVEKAEEIAKQLDKELPKVDLTEEEKEELEEESEETKAAYILNKRAGVKLAMELKKSGVLEKIAMQMIAPHMDKIISAEVGRTIAKLEKKGAVIITKKQMDKVVSAELGKSIGRLEKRGAYIYTEKQMAQGASRIAVQMVKELEKQGRIKIVRSAVKPNREKSNYILKEAAGATAEGVIQDLFKMDIGKNINKKLKKLVNPT